MSHKKYFTYEEYNSLIVQLAKKIKNSGIEFDQIICLARGGLLIGDAFSRIFKKPLGIMFASSYMCEKRSELIIDYSISKQYNYSGKKILLVDDLVDSGNTIKVIREHLLSLPNVEDVISAVLWYKPHSIFIPDFFVDQTTNDDWLVQPFEQFDDEKI